MKHRPAVGISAGAVAESEKTVIQERCQNCGFSRENHCNAEGHEENLVEGDHPENVPTLVLHQADQHASTPPRILPERVQQREGVGGEVEDSKEDDWQEHECDGGGIEEDQREEEVVS